MTNEYELGTHYKLNYVHAGNLPKYYTVEVINENIKTVTVKDAFGEELILRKEQIDSAKRITQQQYTDACFLIKRRAEFRDGGSIRGGQD
jgi:hypothetical protein